MKSIIVLEHMIDELTSRISAAKKQLSKHNSGEEVLSLIAQSSAENNLEINVPLLNKYHDLLKEFDKYKKLDSIDHWRFKVAIERKKYYKNNNKINFNNKKIKYKENDEKIEAVMIMDELPEKLVFEERELFDLSFRAIEQYIVVPDNEKNCLSKIQSEFNNLIKGVAEEDIKYIELLNYIIPIVIFHFHIFMVNIIEYKTVIENVEMKELEFFPKYHDWWITELWTSHLAYFALYQWKNTITKLCVTENQKKVWEIIFNNWIFIKSLLSVKSAISFEYQFIIDTLMEDYVKLSSELDIKIVNDKKSDIMNFIKAEDLLLLSNEHNVITPYINYKISNRL